MQLHACTNYSAGACTCISSKHQVKMPLICKKCLNACWIGNSFAHVAQECTRLTSCYSGYEYLCQLGRGKPTHCRHRARFGLELMASWRLTATTYSFLQLQMAGTTETNWVATVPFLICCQCDVVHPMSLIPSLQGSPSDICNCSTPELELINLKVP